MTAPVLSEVRSLADTGCHGSAAAVYGLSLANWPDAFGAWVEIVRLYGAEVAVSRVLADWLDADPEAPHAQLIAAELKRIADRYHERIVAAGGESV